MGKLSADVVKNECAARKNVCQFQPMHPKKTTHTLHIQAWIQDRNFRATGGEQTE